MHQRAHGLGPAEKRRRVDHVGADGAAGAAVPSAWQTTAFAGASAVPQTDPYAAHFDPRGGYGGGADGAYGVGGDAYATAGAVHAAVLPPGAAGVAGVAGAPGGAGGVATEEPGLQGADLDSLLFGDVRPPTGMPGEPNGVVPEWPMRPESPVAANFEPEAHGPGESARGGGSGSGRIVGYHGNSRAFDAALSPQLPAREYVRDVSSRTANVGRQGGVGRQNGRVGADGGGGIASGGNGGAAGVGGVMANAWDGTWRVPPSRSAGERNSGGAGGTVRDSRRAGSRVTGQPATIPTDGASADDGVGARPPQEMSLSEIKPVMDALTDLGEASPANAGLRQLIASVEVAPRGRGSNAPGHLGDGMEKIMAFRGFPYGAHPDPAVLVQMTKPDLDSLAWAFAVNRSGRKADIARRIIDYLRAPLSWVFPQRRRPVRGPTGRRTATSSSGLPAPAGTRGQLWRTLASPQQRRRPTTIASSSSADPRVGAENFGTPAVTNNRDLHSRLLSEFNAAERESHAYDFSSARRHGFRGHPFTATSVVASVAAAAPSGPSGRRKQDSSARAQFNEMLANYDFMSPENPFHVPSDGPLGHQAKYRVFRAEQLNRGEEPKLSFHTPAPRPAEEGVDHQIHLRCVRVENGKLPRDWAQYWPFPAIARINDNPAELNQAQRYTSGKLAGIDMATNITPFLRKHKPKAGVRDENIVCVRRHASPAAAATGSFVLFAQQVRVLSNSLIREQVILQSKCHWDDHFAKVRLKLDKPAGARSEGGSPKVNPPEDASASTMTDFDIAKRGVCQFMNGTDGVHQSAMRVSLKCPLMLTRIGLPVKGKACKHIQCFDLDNYLVYTRRSSKFVCPVCNQPDATPRDLLVSPYVMKALEMFECDEIEIDPAGNISAVETKRTGVASDDDDDDIGGEDGKGGRSAGNVNGASSHNSNVVDLTLSDDDERGDDAGTSLAQAARPLNAAGVTTASQAPLSGLQGIAPGSSFDTDNWAAGIAVPVPRGSVALLNSIAPDVGSRGGVPSGTTGARPPPSSGASGAGVRQRSSSGGTNMVAPSANHVPTRPDASSRHAGTQGAALGNVFAGFQFRDADESCNVINLDDSD